MIHPDTLALVRAHKRRGDLVKAAQIYHERYRKTITPRHLHYLINGESATTQPLDDRRHDPLEMLSAITEAITQRQDAEKNAANKAAQLIQTILRDTKPTQPIAL
jgi:hypothetical protein